MGFPEAYKWSSFHEIQEAGILALARNRCWYSEEIIVSLLLGDFLMLEVLGELFQVGEADAGLEQQLVTSLDFQTQ